MLDERPPGGQLPHPGGYGVVVRILLIQMQVQKEVKRDSLPSLPDVSILSAGEQEAALAGQVHARDPAVVGRHLQAALPLGPGRHNMQKLLPTYS